MNKNETLMEQLRGEFESSIQSLTHHYHEVTLECEVSNLKSLLKHLKENINFSFNELIDICAVDYLYYGKYDWETNAATEHGFSRGVERLEEDDTHWTKPRFGVVYHLLSTIHNQRLRVKTFVNEQNLIVPSVHDIWKAANWFEREAYDLYGILFDGHPDLRRILTDYGFIGHPFRKDFPLSGHVEMRYDATLEKVIYEPVDITPRILVPKVIRHDNRYKHIEGAK